MAHAGSKIAKNIARCDPHVANTRLSTALPSLQSDDFSVVHVGPSHGHCTVCGWATAEAIPHNQLPVIRGAPRQEDAPTILNRAHYSRDSGGLI